MDAVVAERTHLRCSRGRARLKAEGDTHAPLTSCHRRYLRGAPRGRADARSAVRRCAWARHSAGTATSATIFRDAFAASGLPYFNPHSLRNTLVRLGQTMCQTPEDFKAWSQNLGHEGVLTTFYSYGAVENRRQGEIIGSLAKRPLS